MPATKPCWPRLVLGYEYQSREGDKSTLQWGTVTQPGSGSRNVYPSAKAIEERTHIIKFDLTHEVSGWRIEDSARVEFYDLRTHRILARMVVLGPAPNRLERVHERASHVQGANSIRVEKQFREWWLGSAGYFYSRFDGDSQFQSGPSSVVTILWARGYADWQSHERRNCSGDPAPRHAQRAQGWGNPRHSGRRFSLPDAE